MKQNLFLLIFSIFCTLQIEAQSEFTITLNANETVIQNGRFYIYNVVDNRANRDDIGTINIGDGIEVPANFRGYLAKEIKLFVDKTLPYSLQKGTQIPIELKVQKFTISERKIDGSEEATVTLVFDYVYEKTKLFTSVISRHELGENAEHLHELNIKEAIILSLIEFNENDWEIPTIEKQKTAEEDEYVIDDSAYSNKDSKPISEEDLKIKNRNVFVAGFGIGSIIGVDYEFRLSDLIGVHIGGGLIGYTGGVNFHFNDKKSGGFAGVGFQDFGFGALSLATVDGGGIWVFNQKKRDFGLYYRSGIGKLLAIDYNYEKLAYPNGPTPEFFFRAGVGLTF